MRMASSNEETVSLSKEKSLPQNWEIQTEVEKASENPKSSNACFSVQNYEQGLSSSSLSGEDAVVKLNDADPEISCSTYPSEIGKDVTVQGRLKYHLSTKTA